MISRTRFNEDAPKSTQASDWGWMRDGLGGLGGGFIRSPYPAPVSPPWILV